MARLIRILFSSFILPAAIYGFEPALDAIFKAFGLDTEKWAIATLAWLRQLMMAPWFPYVATAGVCLFVGVWLHYLASRFDFRKTQKFKLLAGDISALKNEIWEKSKTEGGGYRFAEPDRQLFDKLYALYDELERAGVKTPSTDAFDGYSFTLFAESYLAAIEPYAKYGQWVNANRAGEKKIRDTSNALRMIAETSQETPKNGQSKAGPEGKN